MRSNNHSRWMTLVLSALFILFLMLMAGCKPRYNRGSVSGRITDRDGNPITGARVVVMDLGSENDLNNTSSFSGRDGQFFVPVRCVQAGLSAYGDGYAPVCCMRKIIMGVNRDWLIKLTKLVPVSGRVLDTNGDPVPNRILNFRPLKEELSDGSEMRYYMNCTRNEYCTDAQGVFNIPAVAPLKCEISVGHTDGHLLQQPVGTEVFDLTDAANRANLEIRINPPKDYSVSGYVRDVDGNPVPRAIVKTYVPHGQTWWAMTDNSGAFCLEGLDGFGKDTFDINFMGSTQTSDAFNITKSDIPLHAKDLEIVVP